MVGLDKAQSIRHVAVNARLACFCYYPNVKPYVRYLGAIQTRKDINAIARSTIACHSTILMP
jgi:uncharacterized protein involved in tolerance to divalent cations